MMSDPENWLPGVRRLDPEALGAVYDALSPALFRYAFRLLGEAQVAEDVVAESFSRLMTAVRHGGGPQVYLRAYLYRVAHNLAMDHHRASPSLTLDDGALQLTAEAGTQDDDVRERLAARQALWRLTAEQRQVIVLKFYQGLSNEEVAAALNKPVGAVKSLQHRALDALRRMLSPRTGEMERVA
jgi:RNA polymerase sigma-70 factor (ECF subfamily)